MDGGIHAQEQFPDLSRHAQHCMFPIPDARQRHTHILLDFTSTRIVDTRNRIEGEVFSLCFAFTCRTVSREAHVLRSFQRRFFNPCDGARWCWGRIYRDEYAL